MLPDWVSNPGALTYESDALPIPLHGPGSLNFIILKPCSLVILHVKFENHGSSGFRE